ncbi:MAG: hypothetical protein HY764_01930 [Candidatus Portnoybacteria bacterium]|nr:hypothetical protein [Candidatus Portnoybacteria bacterium]
MKKQKQKTKKQINYSALLKSLIKKGGLVVKRWNGKKWIPTKFKVFFKKTT